MNNTIQNDDVLRDDRLEDSEIANVLSSLKLSEFKKTNEPNLEPDQSFKPRSLMEIAQSAHKEIKKNDNESDKNETEGSVLKASEGLSSSEDQSSLGNQELDENLIEDKVDSAGGDIQSETTKTVSDLDLDSENSKDQFNQQVKSEDKEEEKNVLTSEKSGTSEALSVGVETAKQAFDRGYGEGEKAGRLSAASELKANIEAESRRAFEDKVTSLEAAIESLTKFEVSQVNSLSEKIRETILDLTSKRVGSAIEELPDSFIQRIESLAETIGKTISAGQIFLNPDDCSVIAPVMASRPGRSTVLADPRLSRGDIRLKFGGIEIEDNLVKMVEYVPEAEDYEQSANELAVDDKSLVSSDELLRLEKGELGDREKTGESPEIMPLKTGSNVDKKVSDSSLELMPLKSGKDTDLSEEGPLNLMPLTSGPAEIEDGGETSLDVMPLTSGPAEIEDSYNESLEIMPLTTDSEKDKVDD